MKSIRLNKNWLPPIFFAIYSVFFLYAQNLGKIFFYQIIPPLFLSILLTIVSLLIGMLLIKRQDRASIFITLLIVLFFSYGNVASALKGNFGIRERYSLACWGLLLVSGGFLILRSRLKFRHLVSILNLIFAILIIYQLFVISIYYFHHTKEGVSAGKHAPVQEITVGEIKGEMPDIYYLIFDRYANEEVLKEFYDFDNSPFLDALRKRGFYVASESLSNYLRTPLSLASSLNLEYINYLAEQVGRESTDHVPLFNLLQDYKVWRFLKKRGYSFINFGSWYWMLKDNKFADRNFELRSHSEFLIMFYRTTWLYPVMVQLDIGVFDFEHEEYRFNLAKFEALGKVPQEEGPKFIFTHMMMPHYPYVFDRDGNYVSYKKARTRTKKRNYVEQLVFTNKKIIELVDNIIEESRKPPIIILQSDEGPYPVKYSGMEGELEKTVRWDKVDDQKLREKTGILNAYYFPGEKYGNLYPEITPVNSFRVLFNEYFDTDFTLLPDKVYATPDVSHPYDFFDITGRVK